MSKAMYSMEPLFDVDESTVQADTTMYPMQSYFELEASKKKGLTQEDRLMALKARQESNLKQLEELAAQVSAMLGEESCKMGKHGQVRPDDSAANKPCFDVDIALYMNPDFPAWATLQTIGIINNAKKVSVRKYWHSTNTTSCPGLQTGHEMKSDKCDLRVNLIWIPVDAPYMKLNPSRNVSIEGDANIARYLCQTFKLKEYTGDVLQLAMVDELIAEASALETASSRDAKKILSKFNVNLGKEDFLNGSKPCLADFLLWSMVECHVAASLPSNVKAWYKRMGQLQLLNFARAATEEVRIETEA